MKNTNDMSVSRKFSKTSNIVNVLLLSKDYFFFFLFTKINKVMSLQAFRCNKIYFILKAVILKAD